MAHEPRTVPRILINWVVVAAHGSRLTAHGSGAAAHETHSSQLCDSPYDLTRPPTHCRPAADPGPPARATHCASRSPAPHTARRSLPRSLARALSPYRPSPCAPPTPHIARPSHRSLTPTHPTPRTRARAQPRPLPHRGTALTRTHTPHTRTRTCLFSAARQIGRHGDVIPGCTPRAPT